MQKDKGLVEYLNKVSIETLSKYSMTLLIIWILSPFYSMVFNILDINIHTMYNFWMMVLEVTGALGLSNGLLYLYKLDKNKYEVTKLPIIFISIFFVLAFVSTLLSESKWMALSGYDTARSTFPVYCYYAGMALNGLVTSLDKKRLNTVIEVFVAVSTVLSVISLMNNSLTDLLCVNEQTNCPAYTSVFFNTNHYAYYLLIVILTCAFLYVFESDLKNRIVVLLIYSINIVLLILNNTMGSYLAVLLTLVFVAMWSFVSEALSVKRTLAVVVIFLLISILSNFYKPIVLNNFISLFGDLGIVVKLFGDNAGEYIEESNSVGSYRGALWKEAIILIRNKPLIGYGPQNNGLDRHNLYLQIAVYLGLPALICYLSFLISSFRELCVNRFYLSPYVKATAFIVIGYLISSFFGVNVFYTEPYFYIVLGICLSEIIVNR